MLKRALGILFVSLMLISLIAAEVDFSNSRDPLGVDQVKENIENKTQVITDEQARSTYLKQEWTKIFEKSEFGKMLLGISSLLTALGPIFKLLVGIEYSLSWYFIFVFAIWTGVVILIYNLTKAIFPDKKLICFFISVIIVGISSQMHVIELAVNFMAPLFTNPWIIFIGIFVGIIIFVFLTKLSKILGKIIKEEIKKEKEKRREEKSSLLEKIHDVELKGRGVK